MQQRRIETAVRRQKDVSIAARASGDTKLRHDAQRTINALMDRYDKIADAAGVDTQYSRMRVNGFKHTSDKELRKYEDADRFSKAAFRDEKTLSKHVSKHIDEYGGISAEEYVDRARNLLRAESGNDIMKLTRSDGSISKYRISTNEFVASDAKGNIRTAFKPEDGMKYWEDEMKRNNAD